jgi:quercetin dioxygenase-like cupin family protein
VTPQRHVVRRAGEAQFTVPEGIGAHAEGFRRWAVVGEETPGAVHTGFDLCELAPGGRLDAHVHSFEQTAFVLDGTGDLQTPEATASLRPGDYGLLPVGAPHAWRNAGDRPVRWVSMSAPQPRARFDGDTFVVPPIPDAPRGPIDVRDPRTRSFGHIDPENMDVDKQTQDRLAVSASMRTALLVYSGITVKMMVDTDLGAYLQTMFMVQYEPGGFAGPHDHPLEETYLILEGETDAVFDGEEYHLVPGDVAWAGVGCVHQFANPGDRIVRWLETQAPGPPSRHTYRYRRDWDYLRGRLDERGPTDG